MLDALNRAVHTAYNARVESFVHNTGLYPVLYGIYERVLGVAYRDTTYTFTVENTDVDVHMVRDAEIVSILHTFEKEADIVTEFASRLRPTDVVWDIGANLGVYSVTAAAIADHVVGFEPHPVTAGRARENLDLNEFQNAEIREVGLWDETKTSALSTDRDELGTQTPAVDSNGSLVVELMRGADVDARSPSVVKIDVEGAERRVLDGLADVLASVRLLLVEAHDETSIDWLEDQGYRLSTIGQHNGERFVLAERETSRR